MKRTQFFQAAVAMQLLLAVTATTLMTACNSNDDDGPLAIGIPGITIDPNDDECCSAEEALLTYRFLDTVTPIPELRAEVGDLYDINVYSATGSLHTGYNDLYFVATKKKTGNYVKDFQISGIRPVMLMTKMNMKHSTPTSIRATTFDTSLLAVRHAWVSFLMPTSDAGWWSIGYDAVVVKTVGALDEARIDIADLPKGQQWLQSFKVDGNTYYLTLADPTSLRTGSNTLKAYISKKGSEATTPYGLATEQFTVDIDPRMPDMGNHTSPDNAPLRLQSDGSYQGTINLTMTGLWRIHLTVKDTQGNVVAGGDDLKDGQSSLYWDVTI